MRQMSIVMICLVWISVLPCNAQITIKDYTPVDSIDAEKMFAQPKVSWMVMHAYWPTDAFAAKHTYPGDVQLETEELIQLLNKVMRDEVEPSEEDIYNHLQAYTNLWEGSDYLILRYTTESGLRISVQEGSRLFIEVES